MAITRFRHPAAAALAGGLLLLPVAGCTGDEPTTGSSVLTAAESAAETASENVDCSGDSCELTLDSGSAEAEVLGTRLSYESSADGEATLSVGDETVTCSEGDTVTAGPLELECTTVSEESVTLTATLN